MGRYIDTLPYRNMQHNDTGINTIFNVLIHCVSQFITIIGYIDLNNVTYMFEILKLQIRVGFAIESD